MPTKKKKPSNSGPKPPLLECSIAAILVCLCTVQVQAEKVIIHLKNGDRIGGELVSQTTDAIIVDTAWAKGLRIPTDQLVSKEVEAGSLTNAVNFAEASTHSASTIPKQPQPLPAQKPAVTAKQKNEWKFDAKLGADMIRGERDRDIYYGQFAVNYAHPYESNPKKFFRNKLDIRMDYGTTDGNESANRLTASDKTDFDFGKHAYAYNYVGGGFDKVRRIESQIEGGPGAGYHLFRKPNFVLNLEGGLTYQYQNRDNAMELDSLFGRVGQDCTWKLYPKITFSQRSAVLASLEDSDQVQFRLEANLSFGIVEHLSLNLTAIELYDTRPVPGVTRSEFQLRSALGVDF